MIAALNDLGSFPWHNGKFLNANSTSTGKGAGASNTRAIISAMGTGNYAASMCARYVYHGLNEQYMPTTYSDWFLPSRDELDLMITNLGMGNGFATDYYWSSSEIDNNNAYSQHSGNRGKFHHGKHLVYHVRPIREF